MTPLTHMTPSPGESGMPDNGESPRPSLNPTALSVSDAALVLTRAGGIRVTHSMIEQDVADGAPTNPDGTLNLVHYAAWLVKEMGRGD
jgi:hypothetical protein